MARGGNCSNCGNEAAFICLCAEVLLCAGMCLANHIIENPGTVHSTIPVSMSDVLTSGLTEEDIIRRNAIASTISHKVREQSSQLDTFAEETSAKIRTRGEELINYVNKLREEKAEALRTACEAAQAELQKLLSDLEGHTPEGEVNRGHIMMDNVLARNLRINDIKLAEYSYTEVDVKDTLANFVTATAAFPSDELHELRLDEEAKQREEEEKRKAELLERLKTEKKLQRFSGIYGSWNVSSAKIEATTFKCDKEIYLTGVGLGNAYNPGSTTAVEGLTVHAGNSTGGETLYSLKTTFESTYSGDTENQFFKLQFDEPVKIEAAKEYTIRLKYRRGPNVWAAGQTITNSVDGYNFTFSKSTMGSGDQDNNGNSVTAGPTRDLYFS
mmetsp:Transcript_13071/g.24436  ORF Transcript_13071/g.24436 Transcript_13071/m.24436 type:complete len:385 (+) Transcript_13071:1465-2619(+)